MGVTVESNHASSVCSGVSDCLQNTHRAGSSPHARKSRATSKVYWRRSAGSVSDVMEW